MLGLGYLFRKTSNVTSHTVRDNTDSPPYDRQGCTVLPRVSDAECNGNACQALPVWAPRRWGIYATSSCNITLIAAMERDSSIPFP